MKNYGINHDEIKDNLTIDDIIPEAKSPISYFVEMSNLIEKNLFGYYVHRQRNISERPHEFKGTCEDDKVFADNG